MSSLNLHRIQKLSTAPYCVLRLNSPSILWMLCLRLDALISRTLVLISFKVPSCPCDVMKSLWGELRQSRLNTALIKLPATLIKSQTVSSLCHWQFPTKPNRVEPGRHDPGPKCKSTQMVIMCITECESPRKLRLWYQRGGSIMWTDDYLKFVQWPNVFFCLFFI